MNKKWYEIKISVQEELSDIIAEFLSSKYNRGCLIDWDNSIRFYLDEVEISCGFNEKIEKDFNENGIIPQKYEINELSDTDWLSKWKEGFKPFHVGEKILIKPPWEEYQNEDKIVITINPAMAFGTGHHETTSMIIEILQDIYRKRDLKALDILDVGTGSSILSIVCAKLGSKSVIALDNDPEIYENARENIYLNGLTEKIELKICELSEIDGKYDIILANLDSDTILKIGDLIIERLKRGGEIILSGILLGQEREIYDFFLEKNFFVTDSRIKGEWLALSLMEQD